MISGEKGPKGRECLNDIYEWRRGRARRRDEGPRIHLQADFRRHKKTLVWEGGGGEQPTFLNCTLSLPLFHFFAAWLSYSHEMFYAHATTFFPSPPGMTCSPGGCPTRSSVLL